MIEVIEQRVLAAFRFVDRPTGDILTRRFEVSAPGVKFIRNRSRQYVIASAPGLRSHTESFESPPPIPPVGSITVNIQVTDPLKKYLPRMAHLTLPRNANPEESENPDSLFQPIDIALYPSPNAPLRPNWSTVRARVVRVGSGDSRIPVAGSLLRIIKTSNNEVFASGISDERGEALIIIPGVPITDFAEGDGDGDTDDAQPDDAQPDDASPVAGNPDPPMIKELPVKLEVSFNPAVGWPVNPDELEKNHSSFIKGESKDLKLRTGRMEKTAIELTIDP